MPATENSENAQTWKVGALAQLTGVTVRALHHYDHLGLLTPSRHTAAGHRLYTSDDVARLYRISSLRRLGFSLEHIAQVLDDPQWQLAQLVQRHLADISRRVELALALQSRLDAMSTVLARNDKGLWLYRGHGNWSGCSFEMSSNSTRQRLTSLSNCAKSRSWSKPSHSASSSC